MPELARYFGGLELLDPSVTRVDLWGADETEPPRGGDPFHAAVARKP